MYGGGGYGFGRTLGIAEPILAQAKAAKPDYFQTRYASKIAAGREMAVKDVGFNSEKGDIYKSFADMSGGEIDDYECRAPKTPAADSAGRSPSSSRPPIRLPAAPPRLNRICTCAACGRSKPSETSSCGSQFSSR